MAGPPAGWPSMQPQQSFALGPQMTGFAPGGMLPQQTGMPLQPQQTAMPLQPQQTAVPGRVGMGGPGGGMSQLNVPGFGPPRPGSGPGFGSGMSLSQAPPGTMRPQSTGMMAPMQPQPTGVMQHMQQPQMTGLLPQQAPVPMRINPQQQTGMPPQPTGMMPSQPTGLGPQATGLPPQATGMPLMGQATGMMGPMDPRMRMMALQFLPGSVAAPLAGNFSSAAVQPDQFAAALAASGTALGPQKTGMAPRREKKVLPYKLAPDEKKSYEAIFRSWDPKRTGFLDGSLAREVFGQSGLSNDELMQVWNLADTDNRGKLNIAEFQVAMGLLYRALNGNEIPTELPKDMVPTSSRDLNESVDFLKELLTRDASVRAATGINIPLPGRSGTPGKESSLYQDPLSRSSTGSPTPRNFGSKRGVGDAAAYKNDDTNETPVYRSAARHINRSAVRFKGQQPDSELGDLRAQLARTQALVEGTRSGSSTPTSEAPLRHAPKDDPDSDELTGLEREESHLVMEKNELEASVAADSKALTSENLSSDQQTTVADRRRKTERQLMRVAHQQLPLIRERISRVKERVQTAQKTDARARDRRNAQEDPALAAAESRYGYDSPKYDSTKSDVEYRSGFDSASDSGRSASRNEGYDSRPLSAHARESVTASPGPRTPSAGPAAFVGSRSASRATSISSTTSAGTAPPSGPERAQWLREQAQKKVRERMAALGLSAPAAQPSPLSSPAPSPAPAPPASAPEPQVPTPDPEALAQAREEARAARHRAEQKQVSHPTSPAPTESPAPWAPTNPFARSAAEPSEPTGAPLTEPFTASAPVAPEPPTPNSQPEDDSDAEERELARRERELEQRMTARLAAADSTPVVASDPIPDSVLAGSHQPWNQDDEEEEAELVRREAELEARRAARLASVPDESSSDEDDGPEDLDAPHATHHDSHPASSYGSTNPWASSGNDDASTRFPEL